MKYLSGIGCVFYGIAVAAMGLRIILFRGFPYMLIPPDHSWVKNLVIITYISGTLLILAGVCMVLKKKTLPAALLLGSMLLLIFCFYFVP